MHMPRDKALPTQFPKLSVISRHLVEDESAASFYLAHSLIFHFPGFKSEFVSVLLRQTKDAMSIKIKWKEQEGIEKNIGPIQG